LTNRNLHTGPPTGTGPLHTPPPISFSRNGRRG